jgi:hypothetical protein
MRVEIDITFDQLIKVIKNLPASQLRKIKLEIEKGAKIEQNKLDLEAILLNGPTATKKQLEIIEGNRNDINKWRKQ